LISSFHDASFFLTISPTEANCWFGVNSILVL
jgi:hypothetical protein